MNRRWVWLALGVVVVGALAWVAWPSGSESTEQRADRLASELRCIECEGLSVADAATSTARATRAEIVERIEAGDSDAEIRQAYIDRYGEDALMNPQSSGIGAVVWVLPVVVLGLGALGIGFVVARARRTRRAATDEDMALVAAATAPSRTDGGVGGAVDGPGDAPVDGTALEAERDFLLRSIADLDAEYEAGGIDPESYSSLHADYTARAAAVIRTIDAGVDGDRAADLEGDRDADVSWGRRALVIGAVVVFTVVAGVTLAFAAGARLPGGLATGSDPGADLADREQRLRQAVEDNPDDPAAHLALAAFLVSEGSVAEAIPIYDTAARLDPTDPTAPTQVGWLLYLTATGTADVTQQETLLEGARERLDAAVELDPDDPDARVFRGIVALRGFGDADAAVADLQRFLVIAPDHAMADQVRDLLAEAVAQSETPPPTG